MPSLRPASLLTALLALLVGVRPAAAQASPPLFPDRSGDALVEALAVAYAPTATMPYDRARDSLFAVVYREPAPAPSAGDSLRCVYSGRAVYLDPALDPTTAAYNATPRISTEHLWPQNRGAVEGTPAHADLHGLAPVQQTINASRGDSRFGEVPDAEASRWWGPDGRTLFVAPPLAERDRYSEKRNGSDALMEPREAVEGDVARSLFYVWTVYGPHGGPRATTVLDAAFWSAMRPTLVAWNDQDPPSDAERARSSMVARWQGTGNPFVADASLGRRAFGTPTAAGDAPLGPALALSPVAPNPVRMGSVHATFSLAGSSHVRAVVVDALGRTVAVAFDGLASGPVRVEVDTGYLAPGVYALRIVGATSRGTVARFTVTR